jgi:hypothetical protein
MENNESWWDDPKNKEEVNKLSWWNHADNIESFNLPISIIGGNKSWTATFNSETEKLLGNKLSCCASGESKEEAINNMFMLIRSLHEYSEDCRLNYQRFVPFRKGNWKHAGGKWIVIFGINIYFRHGKGMKKGFYIPFTRLNVLINNEWKVYKNYLKSRS